MTFKEVVDPANIRDLHEQKIIETFHETNSKKYDLLLSAPCGSRYYGLHTPDSDYDGICIVHDGLSYIRSVANPNVNEVTFQKIFKDDVEIEVLGLIDWLQRWYSATDLKVVECVHDFAEGMSISTVKYMNTDGEALEDIQKSTHDFWMDFTDVVNSRSYFNKQYTDMYAREITRRYNKLFHPMSNHNKDSKHFNEELGYDTKAAAHLYRVASLGLRYLRGIEIKFSETAAENNQAYLFTTIFDQEEVKEYTGFYHLTPFEKGVFTTVREGRVTLRLFMEIIDEIKHKFEATLKNIDLAEDSTEYRELADRTDAFIRTYIRHSLDEVQ